MSISILNFCILVTLKIVKMSIGFVRMTFFLGYNPSDERLVFYGEERTTEESLLLAYGSVFETFFSTILCCHSGSVFIVHAIHWFHGVFKDKEEEAFLSLRLSGPSERIRYAVRGRG
jgi:hypothetical protein